MIGLLLAGVCGNDATVQPDGAFAMGLSYCGISRPAEHLYQKVVMLTFMPAIYVGPLVGWIVTVAWWCLGIAVLGGCMWHLWRALVKKTIERL